jgi:hypothetical protein
MRSLLALALLALSLPLHAQGDEKLEQKPPFSYLFLNAAATRDRDRELDVVAEGFSLGGSVDLAENAFLTAGYSHSETGKFQFEGPVGTTQAEVEDDGFSIGVGGHKSLSRRTDLTTALAYVSSLTKVSQAGQPEEEDRSEGGAASVGLRHLIHPWVEISAGSSYSFVAGERGWDWSGGVGLMMTRAIWMDIDYYRSAGQDSDGWSLGLRTVLGGG